MSKPIKTLRRKTRKHKVRKRKTRKHKTSKYKVRKHRVRKHRISKRKTRKHKDRKRKHKVRKHKGSGIGQSQESQSDCSKFNVDDEITFASRVMGIGGPIQLSKTGRIVRKDIDEGRGTGEFVVLTEIGNQRREERVPCNMKSRLRVPINNPVQRDDTGNPQQ